MIRIEKNIPIPDVHRGRGRQPIYPFAQMDVGDSFAAPVAKWNTIRTVSGQWAKRLGRQFVTRRDGDSIRVWRVA